MTTCLLCLKKLNKIQFFEIFKEICTSFTVENAIHEYFNCSKSIFESQYHLICISCYNSLKNFHEFTTKIENLHTKNLKHQILYDEQTEKSRLKNSSSSEEIEDNEEHLIEDLIEYDETESIDLDGHENNSEDFDYFQENQTGSLIKCEENFKKCGKISETSQEVFRKIEEFSEKDLENSENSGKYQEKSGNFKEVLRKTEKFDKSNESFLNNLKKNETEIRKVDTESPFLTRIKSQNFLNSPIRIILPKNIVKVPLEKAKFLNISVGGKFQNQVVASTESQNKVDVTKFSAQEISKTLSCTNKNSSDFIQKSSVLAVKRHSEAMESQDFEDSSQNLLESTHNSAENENSANIEVPNLKLTSKSPKTNQKIHYFDNIKCPICSYELRTFLQFTKHFQKFHKSEKPFVTCCDRKFTDRGTFLDHINHHKSQKSHKCEICAKTFKNSLILKNHVQKIHSNFQNSLTCKECGKIYTNKYILKTHMRKHVVDHDKSYECYICKKSLKNFQRLLDHFKYKHDPAYSTSSVCHICSKTVTRLDIHLRQMHSTEPTERVKCDICGHFMKKSSLRGHLATHSEPGYNCEICRKFLKNKNSFLCHMKRVHTAGKFKCEHCGKDFHQENRLIDHIACQHTRAFLYQCRVSSCEKKFRNAGRRRMHERRIHPNEYEKNFKASYLRENVADS